MSDLLAEFTVRGRPRSKGSLKVITPRGKKPRLIEDLKHSVPWRQRMMTAMRDQDTARGITFQAPHEGPVQVVATFLFERRGATALASPYPTVNAGINANGDLDKLLRNLLDALQGAGVIKDDCQVVSIVTRKGWAPEAGVEVTVHALDD